MRLAVLSTVKLLICKKRHFSKCHTSLYSSSNLSKVLSTLKMKVGNTDCRYIFVTSREKSEFLKLIFLKDFLFGVFDSLFSWDGWDGEKFSRKHFLNYYLASPSYPLKYDWLSLTPFVWDNVEGMASSLTNMTSSLIITGYFWNKAFRLGSTRANNVQRETINRRYDDGTLY